MRERYYVVTSAMYILLGGIIVVRSVTGRVLPLIVLGLVFVALGIVRLRSYRARSRTVA